MTKKYLMFVLVIMLLASSASFAAISTRRFGTPTPAPIETAPATEKISPTGMTPVHEAEIGLIDSLTDLPPFREARVYGADPLEINKASAKASYETGQVWLVAIGDDSTLGDRGFSSSCNIGISSDVIDLRSSGKIQIDVFLDLPADAKGHAGDRSYAGIRVDLFDIDDEPHRIENARAGIVDPLPCSDFQINLNEPTGRDRQARFISRETLPPGQYHVLLRFFADASSGQNVYMGGGTEDPNTGVKLNRIVLSSISGSEGRLTR